MQNSRSRFLITVLIFTILVFTFQPVHADDVTDSVMEALQLYKKGDLAGAAGNLDYAAQLIRQKKGDQLQMLLPKPLPGWNAEDADSQAIGTAMLGGAITASRKYRKGGSRVTVSIVTDSPMLQSIMMMFTNPIFAQSGGGRIEKINGHKAIINFKPKPGRGKIQMVVANRFLITVEGHKVSKEEMVSYIQGIDLKTLASLP